MAFNSPAEFVTDKTYIIFGAIGGLTSSLPLLNIDIDGTHQETISIAMGDRGARFVICIAKKGQTITVSSGQYIKCPIN